MISYAIILWAVAALFIVFGVKIYKGRTDLIHDYHQTQVKDKKAYGKAYGKVMWLMGGTMALSGAVGLLGDSGWPIWASLGILFLGFFLGIAEIIRVQKKYNGKFM